MPDFAPDFTPRYTVEYLSAGLHHHVTVRGFRGEDSSLTISRGASALHDMLDPLEGILPVDFAWLSAEYTPEDTNVSVPTSIPEAIVGVVTVAEMSNQDKASSIGWVGRSASTPMRLFIFGFQYSPDEVVDGVSSKFRVYGAESASFASSIAALNASGLAANNDLPGAWHQYVNFKLNDYWLRVLRKLGSL